MRDSLKETEQIEKYLLGKLNEIEQKEIQQRIEEDIAFSKRVEVQRNLMKRIEVIAIKEEIKAAHQRNVTSINTNWLSQKGILFSILIVVLVTIITIVFLTEKEYKTTNEIVKQEEHFIQPPLDGIDVPFIYKSIDPTIENVLGYGSGSILIIPPLAFTNEKGNTVLDTVQIQFREFSDAFDLYVSGIPMDYSIEGKEYPFESAAMCEIYALQKGNQLKLKAGKEIEVAQSTYTTSEAFNLYRFNKKKGSWEEKGKDIAVDLKVENNLLEESSLDSSFVQIVEEESLLDQLTEQEETPLLKPQKATPEGLSFSISYEEEEFPELKNFDNVLFEIDESASNFLEGDNNIEWEDVRIERGNTIGKYQVIFTKDSEGIERKYSVKPVFDGESYSDALNLYNQKMKSYTNKRSQRKKEKTNQDRIQQVRNLARERRNNYIDSMNTAIERRNVVITERNQRVEQQNKLILAKNRNLLARMDSIYQLREKRKEVNRKRYDSIRKNNEMTNELKRVYSIDQFGIWNSDCPINLPKGAVLATDFTMNGQSVTAVVLIDKGVRSLFNCYSNNYNHFQYNPSSDNVVWAVVDQKVVYFNEFESVPTAVNTPYVFVLKELDIPVNNYETIKLAMMNL